MSIFNFVTCCLSSLIITIFLCSSCDILILPRAVVEANTLPRSENSIKRREQFWNPSPQIDEEGFLEKPYYRIPAEYEEDSIGSKHHKSKLAKVPVRIRQVPGDGNCLFHAIYISLRSISEKVTTTTSSKSSTKKKRKLNYSYSPSSHQSSSDSIGNAYDELREASRELRQRAVDELEECLQHPNDERGFLYLEGEEFMNITELLESAASMYYCTPNEYCTTMREEFVWGGGPEVVALCNVLERPIHMYQLCSTTTTDDNGRATEGFILRRGACFGSPKFDHKKALHILSADSRFPDLTPGQQKADGNHFLAVFPCKKKSSVLNKKKRRRIVRGRGGGSAKKIFNSNTINIILQKLDEYFWIRTPNSIMQILFYFLLLLPFEILSKRGGW